VSPAFVAYDFFLETAGLEMRRFCNAFAAAVLAVTLGLGISSAHAQQKPTRLLIFAAGGPVDFVGRILAAKLSPLLGTPVVIEPRPGANGVIAAQAVANAEPDGTTLLLSSSGLFTITPTLTRELPYDTDRDFVPVSRIVVNATAFVVGASLPANNVREFVEFANSRKEPLAFGSPGIGNIGHLWIETFKAATKLHITHVPYKGIAPVLIDVLGGRVAGTFADMPALLPHIKSGKMKALGLVGTKRNSAAPDIPTIYEQGFPGVDALSWYGVLAPAKTPPAVVAKIAEALARALADPDLKERLAASGVESAWSTAEELKQLIQNDRARLAKIIVEQKIVAE
jgi:tripartite-type tricarboxylate transporter receptor subunit TctC